MYARHGAGRTCFECMSRIVATIRARNALVKEQCATFLKAWKRRRTASLFFD